jgi:hypothetical protein
LLAAMSTNNVAFPTLTSDTPNIAFITTKHDTGLIGRGDANRLIVMPFGSGTLAQQFHVRVNRWFHAGGVIVPSPIILAVTVGGVLTGLEDSFVEGEAGPAPSHRLAQTITTTSGASAPVTMFSPANAEHVAVATVDLQGCLGVTFELTRQIAGASATTNMNLFYGFT